MARRLPLDRIAATKREPCRSGVRSAQDLATGHGKCLWECNSSFDLDASVRHRYVGNSMHLRKHEGMSVRRWRRSWFTFTWILWIILAGGAAALACTSHPATHVGPHPLLCIDPSNPAVQGESRSVLLAEGRKGRSPSKFLSPVVHLAALGFPFSAVLAWLTHESSRVLRSVSLPTLASPLSVLRL